MRPRRLTTRKEKDRTYPLNARVPPSSTGALATNITDSVTNLRRALEISVTMSKDQREARVVGPDPKEDADKFSQETSMVQTQQGVLVDALAQEARDHLTRIVGADAKELQVKVPELPPPAPPSICDPPGPAPEERPPAPKSEKEVKKMAKEKKKQEALLEAQKEAARRERALVRGATRWAWTIRPPPTACSSPRPTSDWSRPRSTRCSR